MVSGAVLLPAGLPTSVDVLLSVQALESRLPMWSSMHSSGNLLVLKSRVPGPIKTAYVVITNIAHNRVSEVSSARTPGWKLLSIVVTNAVVVAVAVTVADVLPASGIAGVVSTAPAAAAAATPKL